MSSLLIGAMAAVPAAQGSPPLPHPAPPPLASVAHWQEAPEYVALFAPPVHRQAFRAFVSGANLATVLRSVTSDVTSDVTTNGGTAIRSPGAWQSRPENPLDAFGAGGTYDRWKVSRLYGARRPTVARGPRGANGIVDESWTLISPYPAADFTRLEAGTLLLVLRVP